MCGIWLYLLRCLTDKVEYDKLYGQFMKTYPRGPDKSIFEFRHLENMVFGFHRLSIMDPSHKGDQPFVITHESRTITSFCNGEIYNYHQLAEKYEIKLKSGSDCEIIPELYLKIGIDKLCHELEGEFAFVIIDLDSSNVGHVYVCRDRFGIRPLFYCDTDNFVNFSSEMKSLASPNESKVFPPRHYMTLAKTSDNLQIVGLTCYYDGLDIVHTEIYDFDEAKSKVHDVFVEAVESRMTSDRPLGCLLSGGLDSSLVASIASRFLKKKGQRLRTFSIGMDGSTDKYYAQMVATHINSIHTHIELTQDAFIEALEKVIYVTESYDTTTVRASTGQYLICKWISENTDIKVLLIGDGSDELTAGYMYFHNAPTFAELHNDNIRLLKDIHYFDVLRADRGVASNGLEARVPFLYYKFVDLYLSIDPKLRYPKTYGIEKFLLRESFKNGDLLPFEVLYRKKEAFSDGVSSVKKSWYKIVQEFAETKYSDVYFAKEQQQYGHNVPMTKESMYYRKIWESYFGTDSTTSKVIPYYWLPKWCGEIHEPSARVLNMY